MIFPSHSLFLKQIVTLINTFLAVLDYDVIADAT